MMQFFKRARPRLSEAEQALKKWGIEYEKMPDGTLYVPGNMDISCKKLTRLPDLSSVSVGGNFMCHSNLLTSLEGSPRSVAISVFCDNNRLTSLKGAPQSVGGTFLCAGAHLISLEGAPQSVGGNFLCYNSELTSLKGGPRTVGGDFMCDNNNLTSLEGAPASVGGAFSCTINPLTSLEYAPQVFENLCSNFGKFKSWEEVPEDLRMLPEKRARLEAERSAAEDQATEAATVLQAPMQVRRPLTFR